MSYPVPLFPPSVPVESFPVSNVMTEVVTSGIVVTEFIPEVPTHQTPVPRSGNSSRPVAIAPPEFTGTWEFSTKAESLGNNLHGQEQPLTSPELEISFTDLPEFLPFSYARKPALPALPPSPIASDWRPSITPTTPLPDLAQLPDQFLQPTPLEDFPQTPTPLAPPRQLAPRAVAPTPVVEINADRQEFSLPRQVVTAEGSVVLRYQQAVINANRVQVNLSDRFIIASGNVVLRRGYQVLRGDRFRYFFVQNQGTVANASGEIYLPATARDFLIDSNPIDDLTRPVNPGDIVLQPLTRPPSADVADRQPLQGISNSGGYSFVVGGGVNFGNLPAPRSGGVINRLRFQAEDLNFDANGWVGRNVRLTNDPFSPPELELRADRARVDQRQPFITEITAERARLVLDQSTEIPLLLDRLVVDRRDRGPSLLDLGFDSGDRGGLYIQRTFTIYDRPGVLFTLTPQYFIQKATLGDSGLLGASSFGVIGNLNAVLSPTTVATGRAELTSFNAGELENRLRASLRVRQTIGTTLPHFLNLEYTYRDRLFNGSLGFQTVHSSIGAVLVSPIIPLGDTGVILNYQAGIQYINSETNRLRLLNPIRTNNRVNLARYQASASLRRSWQLWEGERLPPTREEGMRYSPTPLRPFLRLNASLTGVYGSYSSGDNQESLTGRIELEGRFGNFSRPYLDYTGFNIAYSQTIRQGRSPFLFDRLVDTRVLTLGIVQQVYGPVRVGFQTAINLDTGRQISTDYLLEYQRRTYSIVLRYNSILQVGSINLKINDFNWNGNPSPFDDNLGIRPVVQGVTGD